MPAPRLHPPPERRNPSALDAGAGSRADFQQTTPQHCELQGARAITAALGGRWHGRSGMAFCPAHPNRRTPALSVADGDDGRILVHCFAGCDPVDVLAALRARGLLPGRPGVGTIGTVERGQALKQRAADARRLEQARRCWAEAGPITGTLAERYLRRRNITCDLPVTLRFHPQCWHGPSARRHPAMVAAVAIGRRLVGVHRTFIAEPGAKIPNAAKMALGPIAGGAVRLSGSPGPLIVGEGVETCLSLLDGLQQRQPRVWASLGTSGMAGLVLPPEPGELVLAADGDAPGERAAAKLADRAASAGWRVRIMSCPAGRDWNDLSEETAS